MPNPWIAAVASLATGLILAIFTNIITCVLKNLDFSGGSNTIRSKRDRAQDYLNQHRLVPQAVERIQYVLPFAESAIPELERLEEQMREASTIWDVLFCALPRLCHYTLYHLKLCKINGMFDKIKDLIRDINEANTVPISLDVEMGGDLNYPNTITNVSQSGEKSSTGTHDNKEDGFDGLAKRILEELKPTSYEKLGVVSIYGMGGIGKSYLAKHVLDKVASTDFPIWAFIAVSQKYEVPDLRRKILKQIIKFKDDNTLKNMDDKQVRDKLRETLNKNRYLIVLDDIWETNSWDDIFYLERELHEISRIPLFPDKNNGSRIILTTRKQPVAMHPNIKRFEHKVELLNKTESLKLFKKKAFPSYRPVSEHLRTSLEGLVSDITEKCRGLPLALTVLGGYLSKHLVNYDTWYDVANDNSIWDEIINVNTNEEGQEINISKILARSYDDLSDELKKIFLYIMAFPEDHIIKSSDLIKLSIAEGFIRSPYDNYKLEKIARSYIDKLYERGLVEVVKRCRAHKRISKIKIHDVLRHWGRRRNERIFTIIHNFDNASHMGNSNVVDRVALHGYCDENLGTIAKRFKLRTLLGFKLTKDATSFCGSESLHAVSLGIIFIRDSTMKFQDGMTNHMKSLRYLCLKNYGSVYLPSSIEKLCNLQTLDCGSSPIKYFPSSLWEISTLRHVHLKEVRCDWAAPRKGFGRNLQTLEFSSIDDDYKSDWNRMFEAVETMEGIVRLSLCPSLKSLRTLTNLSKIRNRKSLEVLKLSRIFVKKIPHDIFPPNLMKIVLDCSHLQEDPMPIFGMLRKLVVLYLVYSYHLKSLDCSVAGGFPVLKHLKLLKFWELIEWKVHNGAMPSLSHVRIVYCGSLQSFPEQLMDGNQLELLELVGSELSSTDTEKLEKQNKFKVVFDNDMNFEDRNLEGEMAGLANFWE